ncbi:MAG TPA: hypothetical protein VN805_17360 [Caulobacteraceae bacterium]|nr:hypothetical protein [Caulobacteraceae bacterium]
MDQLIVRRTIARLQQELADGKPRENEAELRRQLEEQETLLRELNDPVKRR